VLDLAATSNFDSESTTVTPVSSLEPTESVRPFPPVMLTLLSLLSTPNPLLRAVPALLALPRLHQTAIKCSSNQTSVVQQRAIRVLNRSQLACQIVHKTLLPLQLAAMKHSSAAQSPKQQQKHQHAVRKVLAAAVATSHAVMQNSS